MKIYVDLDSVLANFEGGCQKIFDWPRILRKPLQDTRNYLGLSNKEFWDKIDSYGVDWWVDLEPEPWAKDLINIVKQYDRNFCILTSPSLSHFAACGKVLWLQNYFKSKHFKNYIITPAKNKQLLANENAVLIDDNDKNCSEFISSGGKAILFPRIWNSNHNYDHSKLDYVKMQLEKYENIIRY